MRKLQYGMDGLSYREETSDGRGNVSVVGEAYVASNVAMEAFLQD